MSFTKYEKPDSQGLAPPNTPVVIVCPSASSPTGSAIPSIPSDYGSSQILLNEVSLRLATLSLEDQVSLDTEEQESR